MTNPPEAAEALEAVTVTPEDRELFIVLLGLDATDDFDAIRNGKYDHWKKMKAIARHRIAHTRAQPSREDVGELADRLSRWCMNTGFDGCADNPPLKAAAMLKRLALTGSSAGNAEIIERCAAKCLEVSAWIGARHGSSIDSALHEAAAAIRALAQPASEGVRDDG